MANTLRPMYSLAKKSESMAFMLARIWPAKASWNSHTSMSDIFRPACSSTFYKEITLFKYMKYIIKMYTKHTNGGFRMWQDPKLSRKCTPPTIYFPDHFQLMFKNIHRALNLKRGIGGSNNSNSIIYCRKHKLQINIQKPFLK